MHAPFWMIHSIWKDICQPPTFAANRQQYEKRVSDSTTQLQQCIQNVLNVLNDRAIGLTRCANFAAALRDATAMQEISPLSPLGYLRAASIYSEQGKQVAAIEFCNAGLSIVNVNDPGYSKLEEAKTVAMQRATYRIDFISQLPLDIVVYVLFPMLLGDDGTLDGMMGCHYLDISKTWFDRAIQAGGGGLHFKVASQFSYNEVIRLAQHTKSIRIESYQEGNYLSDLFHRANLCSLQELEIRGLHEYTTDVDHLVSSLKPVSNTLIHLAFTTSTSVTFTPQKTPHFVRPRLPIPRLRVADILTSCPRLVMLDITFQFDIDFSAVPLTKTWPQFTALSLHHRSSVISNGEFLAMLKRFPSLEKLVLNACIETQPMTMIQHYCPSMKELQLTTKRIQSSRDQNEQQREDQWMREGRDGLEKISVSEDSRSGDTWMDMCQMLRQHHNTLVHLDLSLDYGGNNDDDLFNLEFPCLKTLTLRRFDSKNACFGWWIMGKAPFLEELSITSWAIASHPTILDTIPPPTLRKLVLNLRMKDTRNRTTVIERYLNKFALEKEWPSLKELNIHYDRNGDIPETLIAACCSLKSVQHMSISVSPLRPQLLMDHFIKMLVEGCPLLISLELNDHVRPTYHIIEFLKGLLHLRYLAFYMDSADEYGDFWEAFRVFPQLKCIRLLSMRDRVNHMFIRYLKLNRPDIKVVTP